MHDWSKHIWSFAIGVFLFGFVILVRTPPVEIFEGEISVSQGAKFELQSNVVEIRQGGSFRTHRNIQWRRHDCGDRDLLTSELVDSLGFHHSFGTTPGSLRGGYGMIAVVGRERTIPTWFPLGAAEYRVVRLEFNCFPFYELWPLTVSVPTLRFTVVQ